ncbi:hypothetical protein M3226_05175 [Neobacillus cucumis]|uniref:hypothetical protein n=1 Tax=Neobacillus cucumis TaxID=1740721 RepID=UPI00203FF01B|nr:hypothetical protein [Neobacillus cucumis]MCM3725089.1 hypothetical protein [Neobacillus cucumis]
MSIMKNDHLKKKIINYNIIPLEVSSLSISDKIHLNIDAIEDFLKFASDTDCKYVYYYYTYYNLENYIIPADYYNEYSGDFKTEVRKHNQHIKTLNFDSPKSLTLFVLQNGTYVGVVLDDPWIDNQGISVAVEAIEEIEHKFYREVKKISDNKKVQQKENENELREIIFNDPEFKLCKNQALRYSYLIELLQKEDMMKYDYLVQPYGYHKDGNVKWFMDITWELFKERERKQKK